MNESTVLGGMVFLYFAVIIFYIVVMWKIFEKADKPGWLAIIPVVNAYCMIKIAKMPGWLIFLYLIPIVNIILSIVVVIKVCEAFGKSVLFGVLSIFFGVITFPILAFGDAQYQQD